MIIWKFKNAQNYQGNHMTKTYMIKLTEALQITKIPYMKII